MIRTKSIVKAAASVVLTVALVTQCTTHEKLNAPLPSSKGVNGFVQKGPFVSGSSITIQILDSLFNPTGQSYAVTTIDDFGSFNLQSQITGSYVELIAQGYYFDEVSGLISGAPLTLRAISKINSNLKSNVNVLTTLSKNRIIYLVTNEGKKFDIAKAQAEQEILALFKIPYQEDYDFNLMDIRNAGTDNAILLAVSAILQGNLSVGQLSELISKIILDVEKDGTLDASTVDTLRANAEHLNLVSVRNNVTNRYTSLGIQSAIPQFELFAKRLVPLMVLKTSPKDGESLVRFDLTSVAMYCNKEIEVGTIAANVMMTDAAGNNVGGTINYRSDSFKIAFTPNVELQPQTTYKFQLLNGLASIDGDKLTDGFSIQFKTVAIDVSSNLVAYYPLDGDASDHSGNNLNGNAVSISYGPNVNGVANSAGVFSGAGSYLELPNGMNMTERVWTYSIWFKLDDLEAGTAPLLLGSRFSGGSFWDVPLYIRSSIKAIATYNETAFGIPDQISLNSWYHVVMVIENGSISLYLNGQLKASESGFLSTQKNTGYPDFLGDGVGAFEYYTGNYYVSEKYRWDFPMYLKGSVDNIRFYRRALNKFEVKKLFDEKM